MTPNDASDQSGRSRLTWIVLLLVMLAAGMAIPGQGRVNAALSAELGDPILAALISFSVGLVLVILGAVALPSGRRALTQVRPALQTGAVKPWYMLAGFCGAYFVLTQTLSIGTIGVAVFTVAVVTGQTLGGLLWDRIGLGPAGRMRLTMMRVFGAALTVLAVLWAVSPQLTGSNQGLAWLLVVLLPLTGGVFSAAQQALNGRQTAVYRNPLPATLFNFIAGTILLTLIWTGKLVFTGGFTGALPSEWWYYAGGPMGVVFIGLGAILVTKVGVLIAAMGMIAGQLVGSLLLDLIVPAPGSVVTTATVMGTVMTLLAVVVASAPDMLRGKGR